MTEEDEKEKKPFKVFVNIEDDCIDAMDIKGIRTEDKQNEYAETGLVFNLKIRTYTQPYEFVFSYATPELRDKKYREFKDELTSLGIVFIKI